jgi:tetratricopeptide (TPR) repeat protein
VFARALAISPENSLAHTNLGQALEAQGRLDEAARHYEEALRIRPQLAPVRANRGKLRLARGELDAAAAELERALAIDPELVDALATLGWTRFRQGRHAEAVELLRRATWLAPDEHSLANNLAWILATSRDSARPEEALAIAEQLCAATGHQQPGFLETLAAALARLGRYDEAAGWQARALARVPQQARAEFAARLALYESDRPFVTEP